MPDGMTTPENSSINSIRNLRSESSLPGSNLQIPESIKSVQNVGPDEGHQMRIGKEGKLQIDPTNPEAFIQSIAERVANELAEGRRGYEAPSFVKLTEIIENDKFPSEKEKVPETYVEATVDLVTTLFAEMNDSRTHVVPEQYGLMRHGGNLQAMKGRLEASLSRYDSFEGIKDEKARALAVVLNADLVRYKAIETMVEHASVYQQFYYDGMYMYQALVTGRRIKVIAPDDFRLMFGKLKGLDVANGKDKIPEIGEGSGERISKMVSDQIHTEMAIAELNRFNPYKENGKETEMEITDVERKFIGEFFTKDSSDMNVKKKTEEIEVNGKKFDVNLLSFYTTMETEAERKKYEATMQAFLVNDVRSELKDLSVDFDLSIQKLMKFDELRAKVKLTRDNIINNWDSLSFEPSVRLAKWANEISFSFNVATLNINELAYGFEWEEKDGEWTFKPAIAGPNTGFDAVNIWLHFQHEIEYMLKGRVRTPMLPSVSSEKAWDVIKTIVVEKEDPKIKEKIIKDKGLSLGAAILGMYKGELNLLNSGDLEQVDKVRGRGFAKNNESKMMSFNEKALKILEKTIFGFEPWVSGKTLPIPIRPMFNGINLLNAFPTNIKESKTVLGALKEGKDLVDPEINFEDINPYAVDGWQVNLKMLGDVMKFLYGQADKKGFQELFQGDPSEAIGTLIKKIDIGTRGEFLPMDLGDKKDDGTPKLTNVPRQFYEIVYTSYIIVANAAFNEHGIWGGGGRWKGFDPEYFWSGTDGKKGIKDWVEAAYTSLPNKKGDFDHYRDSFVLMISALAQWVTSIAPEAEKQGSKEMQNAVLPFSGSYDALRGLGKLNNK